MAVTRRDSKLETRDARKRLEAQHEPYWRTVHKGLAVGYRKGERGGTWYVRRLVGSRYVKERLGEADDFADANGGDVLSFAEAQRKALGEEQALIATAAARGYTVADALKDWQTMRAAKSRGGSSTTEAAQVRVILEGLGRHQVSALTAAQIGRWRNDIANSLRRIRSKRPKDGSKATVRRAQPPEGMDPREAKRRRQATANRLLSVLKAALNHAWREGKATSDTEWRRVEPFETVDMPRQRFLSEAECKRLLNAAPDDFRKLAMGALFTGLRLGELVSLTAGDLSDGRLRVQLSKSGKPRSVPLNAEGAALFAEMAAGKQRGAVLFEHAGAPWHRRAVQRQMIETSKAARLDPPATFHDLRRSYASLLINAGADAATIQKLLGHSDTRMTLRVYAHLLDKTLAAEVEDKLPSFGFKPGNVRSLRGA